MAVIYIPQESKTANPNHSNPIQAIQNILNLIARLSILNSGYHFFSANIRTHTITQPVNSSALSNTVRTHSMSTYTINTTSRSAGTSSKQFGYKKRFYKNNPKSKSNNNNSTNKQQQNPKKIGVGSTNLRSRKLTKRARSAANEVTMNVDDDVEGWRGVRIGGVRIVWREAMVVSG